MDWSFIAKYIPMYVEAAEFTLKIGIIGILCAIAAGLICSIIVYYRIPVFCQVVKLYVELSRNTPLLVPLFFLYFGLPKAGIVISATSCGIIGLTFLGGSYMAEAFRSGLETVSLSQKESGLALGFRKSQIMRYIIFPQAISVSVPAVCANMIFLIKETSVFSVLALPDLMYVTKDLIGLYYKTDEALFMLVVAYLIILLPISIIAHIAERRLRHAAFGN